MYFGTSSSSDNCPRFARSMILIAVNCLDIEAAGKTDAGVMGTPNSRFAMPYARSYTRTPFLPTPKLQPGESDRFHSIKSLSILDATDSASDGLAVAAL